MKQRICGVDVDVIISDPSLWSTNGMGRSSQVDSKIFLRDGMPPDVMKSTNVHEVIHMILDMNGFSEQTNNEALVATLSNGVTAWIRDNREMVKAWIYDWDEDARSHGD